jgi:hypothetical protein
MAYMLLLIPLFAILINAIAQIVSYRIRRDKGLLISIFIGFASGMLMFLLSEAAICGHIDKKYFDAKLLSNAMVYMLLSYCYFHFLNLGETARRIRILRELAEAPAGLTSGELLRRYNAQEILDRRISRLTKSGQIILRNKRYYIKGRAVLLMAKLVGFMKIAMLAKESEIG